MNNKRPLETDDYPDKKRRFPSSGYETDEEDVQIEVNDREMGEIIELIKDMEKSDNRRASLRAWPKEEGNQRHNNEASTSGNVKSDTKPNIVKKRN